MRYISVTFVIISCLCDWGYVTECVSTLRHVEAYNVVRPQLLKSRHRRSISSLPKFGVDSDSQELYPEQLQYQLDFNGNNLTINLEKNRILVGHNYTEIYYQEDGSSVATFPRLEDHCYYHGHISGMSDSSVSVGLCSGMRGFIRAEEQTYLIEPLSNGTEGDHAIYKKDHIRKKRSSNIIYDNEPRVAGLGKHDSWKTKSLFHTKRYVELFLVVDNAEYRAYGSNMDTVRDRMLEVVNHVDKMYRPHNIRVMLVGLEVWNKEDQIQVSVDSDDTLKRFIAWRKSDLLKKVKHDNAQFVTAVKYLGDTVGLANKFAMCAEGSGGVNQDHNKSPFGLAATIAHEMGHNMGMSHDTESCICDTLKSDCIMTERVNNVFPELFSDCSLVQLSEFLENAKPSCLLNPPSSDRLYGGPVCGNAFLDPGEECDCGKVEECENSCCNPQTCKFKEGSQCADGECCENCQFKKAGSLCRAPGKECDLPEYCTGRSERCPADSFKMNGVPCDYGASYCYNGQCPTHLQHCQSLWGKGAKVALDLCFKLNRFGGNDSHCGKTKGAYRPCPTEDLLCGTLFCTGGETYPVTGQKATLRTQGVVCNKVVDRTDDDNLSMVPTGTKCGANKVCFNHKCQDVNVYGASEDCALKCNGRGVCDHRKECHCDPGWAPPYCDIRYDDLPSGNGIAIGVSVAVVLLLLATAFGSWIYCKKSKQIGSGCKSERPGHAGQHNPLFENTGVQGSVVKDHPQISQPTFVGSTTDRPCTPIMARPAPTRPPPLRPPIKSEPLAPPSPRSGPPPPPSKPLPPIHVKQTNRPGHPPVPPMKPVVASESWMNQQAAEGNMKIALWPPTVPRR